MNSTTTYRTVKGIAYGMFGTGLALSITHTFDLFHSTLGAAIVTSAAMPAFVDGIQIIGKLMRAEAFASDTRRLGFRIQLLGAALSLIANVVAGHALGDKIAGAVLVGGYILAEKLAEKIRPVTEDVAVIKQTQAAATAATRSAAAKKAAATRAAKKAEADRKAAERKQRQALSRKVKAIETMEETFAAPAAPVSGVPATTIGYL